MKVLNNSTNCTLSERQLEGICSQSSMAIIKNLKWERKRNYTVSEPFYKYCDDNVLIIEQRSVWYTWNLNNLNVNSQNFNSSNHICRYKEKETYQNRISSEEHQFILAFDS